LSLKASAPISKLLVVWKRAAWAFC